MRGLSLAALALASSTALLVSSASARVQLEKRSAADLLESARSAVGHPEDPIPILSSNVADLREHWARCPISDLTPAQARQLRLLQANKMTLPEAHSFMADAWRGRMSPSQFEDDWYGARSGPRYKPSRGYQMWDTNDRNRRSHEAAILEKPIPYKEEVETIGTPVQGLLGGLKLPPMTDEEHTALRAITSKGGPPTKHAHEFASRTSLLRAKNMEDVAHMHHLELKQLEAAAKEGDQDPDLEAKIQTARSSLEERCRLAHQYLALGQDHESMGTTGRVARPRPLRPEAGLWHGSFRTATCALPLPIPTPFRPNAAR